MVDQPLSFNTKYRQDCIQWQLCVDKFALNTIASLNYVPIVVRQHSDYRREIQYIKVALCSQKNKMYIYIPCSPNLRCMTKISSTFVLQKYLVE